MAKATDRLPEWILPASIPFSDLKGHDLETCLYWLLDSMGAKDLEWRVGGSGAGTADGGRDLEARFYNPTADGEIEAQKWWIECKGRTGTVEASEVKSAVNNSSAIDGLDYLVIATNTQFSNPTIDWVKQWQLRNPRPKVKLWNHVDLERYLSGHPDVVLRLFFEALSLQGRVKAVESRFWNRLEFASPTMLAEIWKSRADLTFEAPEILALIASEFVGGGSITNRSWGANLQTQSLLDVLALAAHNLPYLLIRCQKSGIDQQIICRSVAYLVLLSLEQAPAKELCDLLLSSISEREKSTLPKEIQEMFVRPILGQLLAEMRDVCASDCERIVLVDRTTLLEREDEVRNYWIRFEREDIEEVEDRKLLRITQLRAPCAVGFDLAEDADCPLFDIVPGADQAEDILAAVQKVATFRKRQAAIRRNSAKQQLVRIKEQVS